ncbi:MAG: nucleotide exchange factor GrpE, partial [Candidatus Glassbacteria bacterium RBG_16_58_8]
MSEKKKAEKEKKEEEGKEPVTIYIEDRRSSVGAKSSQEKARESAGVEWEKEQPAGDERYAELVDQMKRLQADFENYRKRVQKERSESWVLAKKELIFGLLPFIDDMRRVMEWTDEEIDIRPLFEGMKLTAKNLMMVLEEEGFERIDALGKPFDPHFHEALFTEETDDPEKDNIVREVLLDGYTFRGSLLRPARVKVFRHRSAKAAEEPAEASDEPESTAPAELQRPLEEAP